MNLDSAREILLNHARSKQNGLFPQVVNRVGKMTNPVCGDYVEIRIFADKGIIKNIGHNAQACAICSASASLICQEILGKSLQQAEKISELFEKAILQSDKENWPEELLAFSCFEHLRVNPSRRMCALLPWVAIKSALRIV